MRKHLLAELELGLYAAIYDAVGAAPEHINPVGVTRFSTNGQRSNTDGWVLCSDNGVIRFGCWRQDVAGWWTDAGRRLGAAHSYFRPSGSPAADVAQERQERARINASIWGRARPMRVEAPASSYLLKRGLVLVDYPSALRTILLSYYEDGIYKGRYPVVLGAVTNQHGELVVLHRTFLTADGHKAPVSQPKKLTRASAPLAGASIKLDQPREINNKLTLGVAEGIETALACRLDSGIPTWSCMSANGMKSFIWPTGLESLVIFADNDKSGVGQAAARDLSARAVAAGLEVRVLVPQTAGTDWLDVYLGEAE
jgi:hypothetical protein